MRHQGARRNISRSTAITRSITTAGAPAQRSSIRHGLTSRRWARIRPGFPYELFDVTKDSTQTDNLPDKYPDKVKEMCWPQSSCCGRRQRRPMECWFGPRPDRRAVRLSARGRAPCRGPVASDVSDRCCSRQTKCSQARHRTRRSSCRRGLSRRRVPGAGLDSIRACPRPNDNWDLTRRSLNRQLRNSPRPRFPLYRRRVRPGLR